MLFTCIIQIGGSILAGISNINNLAQYNAGKAVRKLSFETGEVFSAKIEDGDRNKGEVLLKLINGWKFAAKLDSNVSYNTNIFTKFIVDGYEDGKMKIKIFPSDKKDSEILNDSSKEDILKNYVDNTHGKEDYNILKSLINHNIPLTKENILNVKSLIKLKDSIIENSNKEDEFIDIYMKNKNIDENTIKGKEIKELLKKFFIQLKNIDEDEIAFFIENGIDIDGDNITSFQKLLNEEGYVYKYIENLNRNMNGIYDKFQEVESKNSINRIENKFTNKGSNEIIKEINYQIEKMKNNIEEIFSKGDLSNKVIEKIFNKIDNNINDIKVFNDISQQYYYLDIPLNLGEKEYNFKFILKDDRKSEKKVDSKNVKLIVSINTINMGIIDSFIIIKNKELNIDIKVGKNWVTILELYKNKLLKTMTNMNYKVDISISHREHDVNILNSRSFFNNSNIYNLDKLV